MSNDTQSGTNTTSYPSPPPPHQNYTLGCRPFASASLEAACTHVHRNPLCVHGDVDYLSFYYCHSGTQIHDVLGGVLTESPHWMKLPLLLLWTVILFASIGTVADHFFAPAVEKIAKRLNLSEDVAGATLLAFGGAAPDIFTQAAAIAESGTPDLVLALSESIGSGLFVATVGKALAIFVGLRGGKIHAQKHARVTGDASPTSAVGEYHSSTSPQDFIEVESFPYLRDAVAYGGLLMVAALSVADGEVTTFEALVFVFWYAAYVWAVMRGEDFYRRWKGLKPKELTQGRDASDGLGNDRGIEMVSSNTLSTSTPSKKLSSKNIAKGSPGVFDSAADLESAGAVVSETEIGEASDSLRDRRPRTTHEWTKSSSGSECKYGDHRLSQHTGDVSDDEEHKRLVGETRVGGFRKQELSSASILCVVRSGNIQTPAHRGICNSNSVHSWASFFQKLKRWCVAQSGLGPEAGDDDYVSEDDEKFDDGRYSAATHHEKPSSAHYLAAPIVLAMALTMVSTIPQGKVARPHLATVVVLAPVFALHVTGVWRAMSNGVRWFFCVAWTLVALVFVFTKVDSTGTNPRTTKTTQYATFFTGILWMHMLANELVGVFQAFGRIAGVRESLIGATIMSWGASAGDLGAMLAMARAGFVKMAITASLAGPLCQLAMGTGFSMVLVKLRGVYISSELAPNTLFFMWFGVVSILGFDAIAVPILLGNKFTKRDAIFISGAYAGACLIFVLWGVANGGEE